MKYVTVGNLMMGNAEGSTINNNDYGSIFRDFFFVDTGASDHIICDPRLIIEPQKHKAWPIQIHTGNGTTIAKSYGPAVFMVRDNQGQLCTIVRDAIYCPDFGVNLFSPHKDWTDRGTRISFEDTLTIRMRDGTTIPFSGKGGTYKLFYAAPKVNAHGGEIGKITNDVPLHDPASLWHRRLGHSNLEHVFDHAIMGKTPKLTKATLEHLKKCPICPMAKMKASPHPKHTRTTMEIKAFGDRIHMDLSGPFKSSFQHGYRYMSIFVDEFSLHIGIYFLKLKSDHLLAHKRYVADMAQYGGQEIKQFHSDNGGEYTDKRYLDMILLNGAKKTNTVAKTPNHNPLAEAAFWKIKAMVRAMLADSGMPRSHWAAAALQAVYTINRTPKRRQGKVGMSPYEMLHGRKPDLTKIKLFGCRASALIPKLDRTDAFTSIAEVGFNYGLSRYKRGYEILLPHENRVITANTVRFDETVVYKDVIHGESNMMIQDQSDTTDEDEATPAAPPSPPGSGSTASSKTQLMSSSSGSSSSPAPSTASSVGTPLTAGPDPSDKCNTPGCAFRNHPFGGHRF